MNEWPCPRCGQLTSGTWSEGGCKWAICDRCMNQDVKEARRERSHDKAPIKAPIED